MNCHLERIKRKPRKNKKGDFSVAKIKIKKSQKSASLFLEIYVIIIIMRKKERKTPSCIFFFMFSSLEKRVNI